MLWKQRGRAFYVIIDEHRADKFLEETFKVLTNCNVQMFRKSTKLGCQFTFIVSADKVEELKKHLNKSSY